MRDEWGLVTFAVSYRAPISASAADDITNLMIFATVRTGPFHFGSGSFSDKKMWAPARLRPFDSLLNPASE